MEKDKRKVVFRQRAITKIRNVAIYIESKGFPNAAINFTIQLFDFGASLADFPDKYPVCRKRVLALRNLRCAIFKKDYIFIYKLINDELIIYNVVHARTIA